MVEAWPGGGGGGGRPRAPLPVRPGLAAVLLGLLLGFSWASLSQGRRLICWQAMLQCQEEPDCSYAYSQYAEACAPVLLAASSSSTGDGAPVAAASSAASAAASWPRRRCPSHCISALIQLNHTRRGPALEDCDCDQDENCRATKRAIEPCLPRTSFSGAVGGGGNGGGGNGGNGGGGVIGCTEARRRCDWDSRCSVALSRYMAHCGKLFNGLRCTEECRAVIEDMLAVPKALLLNDCVCDGLERPICESIKENMARLCFGAAPDALGPGSSGAAASDGALDDYYDDEYEDEAGGARSKDELEDAASSSVAGEDAAAAAAACPGKPVDGSPAPWTPPSALSILGPPLLLLLLLFLS